MVELERDFLEHEADLLASARANDESVDLDEYSAAIEEHNSKVGDLAQQIDTALAGALGVDGDDMSLVYGLLRAKKIFTFEKSADDAEFWDDE